MVLVGNMKKCQQTEKKTNQRGGKSVVYYELYSHLKTEPIKKFKGTGSTYWCKLYQLIQRVTITEHRSESCAAYRWNGANSLISRFVTIQCCAWYMKLVYTSLDRSLYNKSNHSCERMVGSMSWARFALFIIIVYSERCDRTSIYVRDFEWLNLFAYWNVHLSVQMDKKLGMYSRYFQLRIPIKIVDKNYFKLNKFS